MEFCLDYVRILFSGILAKFRVKEFCYLDGISLHGIPCSVGFRVTNSAGIIRNSVTNCDEISGGNFNGILLDTLVEFNLNGAK